ncbi:MAG: hypothetical protein AAGA38_06755 [Pseudomonadota bacterium]
MNYNEAQALKELLLDQRQAVKSGNTDKLMSISKNLPNRLERLNGTSQDNTQILELKSILDENLKLISYALSGLSIVRSRLGDLSKSKQNFFSYGSSSIK